jgi:hypothetical protein
MPNNLDSVPTLVNICPQQLIVATANIPPTINAPTFVDLARKFFWVFELEFSINSSEKIMQFATFSR